MLNALFTDLEKLIGALTRVVETILVADVTQIDYLKGFDITGNDGGGSFGKTAVGDVMLAKYGKVQAFVMNAEASGIIVDTPKKNYIISCETKGETLALYEKLKSYV